MFSAVSVHPVLLGWGAVNIAVCGQPVDNDLSRIDRSKILTDRGKNVSVVFLFKIIYLDVVLTD
jgi:hypothetical protein